MTLTALAILAALRASTAQAEATAKWLLVSDIHFDPVHSPAISHLIASPPREWHALLEKAGGARRSYGADANYPLLASSLAAMRAKVESPAAVVIAGDLLAHHMGEELRAAKSPVTIPEVLGASSPVELKVHLRSA